MVISKRRGFIFSDPQRKRESLKSWVRHFMALGHEVAILQCSADGKYLLWRSGKRLPDGVPRSLRWLTEYKEYAVVPHDDLLAPPPWPDDVTNA